MVAYGPVGTISGGRLEARRVLGPESCALSSADGTARVDWGWIVIFCSRSVLDGARTRTRSTNECAPSTESGGAKNDRNSQKKARQRPDYKLSPRLPHARERKNKTSSEFRDQQKREVGPLVCEPLFDHASPSAQRAGGVRCRTSRPRSTRILRGGAGAYGHFCLAYE